MNSPENHPKNKWLEIFQLLSQNHHFIKKCLIKNLNDDRLRDLPIPSIEKFSQFFSSNHIKDVLLGGPIYFQEIESLYFPAKWTTPRTMRGELLAPKQHNQNIENIYQILQSINSIKLIITQDQLIINLCQNPSSDQPS
jgi:hypothetical protein